MQAVERALGDQVRHLELPPERAGRRVLVALHRARHVGHVADQVEHPHRALGAPQAEHDLVGEPLAEGLDGHLPGVQEMRHRLRHRGEEEVAGRRVHVVEVPAPRRGDPELGVLAERARDAAAPFDEHGPRGPQLRQPDARAREPELAKLGEAGRVPAHGRLAQVGQHLVEGALDPLQVLLVLDQQGQRGLHQVAVERLRVEDDERAGPVEALRDRRGLRAARGRGCAAPR